MELYQVEVGPVTNLTLPEKVTLKDVDGGTSLLGGDGTIISASNLLFQGKLRSKLHAHCSFCILPKVTLPEAYRTFRVDCRGLLHACCEGSKT